MSLFKNLALLLFGAVLMLLALYVWQPEVLKNAAGMQATTAANDADKPLYWVAPMDPNYRRDEAGKSPMGMDLVPVYAKDQSSGQDSPGLIEISPEIVNSLGVRTAKVVLDQLEPEIRTVGYLQYNEDSIVHIHPRVEGWVENSYVNTVGAPVEKGQRLYTLYSPALVNAQEELLFGLKRNDQRLIQAAEQRLLALQISDTVIRQIKKDRQVSQTVTFYAPESGVVEELSIREGLYVKPGMTLMSIANLDEIWIEAEVFERQASLIKVGLPVTVNLDFLPGEVRQAKVDYIYPSLDAKTRTLKVRVRLDNTDYALKPNMFAELRILASDQEERLLIPKEALIRGGQQNRVVLALGEGRFKSLAVKTGHSDNQRVEILEGLIEGEEIVTSAQFLLDSESSKSSDFTRIDVTDSQPVDKPSQVWVEVKVNSVDADRLKINLDHGPIDAWQWPQMTMDFQLDEYLDLEQLKPGLEAHAQVTRTPDNKFVITDLHIPEEGMQSNTTDTAMKNDKDHMDSKPVVVQDTQQTKAEIPSKVWVKAIVNSIDSKAMKLNAQHDPVPEWSWPQMQMDFKFSEWVESSEMPTGQSLQLEISRTDSGEYEVTDFFLPKAE